MKKSIYLIFFILFFLNILFASWYVLHNDLHFTSDVARDFLLLDELDRKKIMLIGPRSSIPGLFHGPLWIYVNYPAYLIGNGNPITVGWSWIGVIVVFSAIYYYIAKKLFNQSTALLFVLMTSLYMFHHSYNYINPHGAMFVLPVFFFLFIQYIRTKKIIYLLAHIFSGGLLIQFQMAIGFPFLMLSSAYLFYFILKNKTYKHFWAFFIILIPLSTFILYEIRYNFPILNAGIAHMQRGNSAHGYLYFLADRMRIMLSGTEFLRYGLHNANIYITLIFVGFLILQIKQNKYKDIYFSFIYFWVGFFVLSLINKFELLYFYIYPIFLLVFLIFSSFITSRYKVAFFLLFFVIYATNFTGVTSHLKKITAQVGLYEESWNGLYTAAQATTQGPEKEFGYFVYAPDILGYGPKYAMQYVTKSKNAYSFEKKPTTYLLIAPPPRGNPFMLDSWWKNNQVHIQASPSATTVFKNGYKVEKYSLSEEEIKKPFDPAINPGLHFR